MMRINHKQQELIDELFNTTKGKFPEIELINITPSPEDPADIFVNVLAPMDEDREIELRQFTSELEADILQDYGYLICIMPKNTNIVTVS